MNRTLQTICLCAVAIASALAGTTGKISGRVTDRASGEPLPGANVVVAGSTVGAATDMDGAFVLMNIPPGTVDLRVTLVGYAPTTIQNVRVVVDQTTIVNPRLSAAAVEMGELIVQAERPLVQKDNTATVMVVSSEQIDQLPVKDFVEVLQMQAGVVGSGSSLNVRGGRGNEVAYLIDGMYVQDPVLGGLGSRIHNDAIQELNFLSGTFNAEYGNALSGVVNIVTKEGGGTFTGKLEGRTSQFGVSPYKSYMENRVNATVAGPIAGDALTFFLSGERDARGHWLPWGYDNAVSMLGKVSIRPITPLKLVLSSRYTENDRRPYNHSWKYIPDQYLKIREKSRHHTLTLTHTVLPNLFYDLRASYFNQMYYSGVDKDTSAYILPGDEETFLEYGNGFEFYKLADPIEIINNQTQTWNLKGDLVWQIGSANEVKFGVEFKKHRLNYFNVYDPKRNFPYITIFDKDPLEAAAYLQDKIELNALVVNLGLRFDYADQQAPFRADPLSGASIIPSRAKWQISPRLGVAHPISDRTSLHFSYGHFFQRPDYNRFFENGQYDLSVREPLFGQPDLDAERTVAYEVGLTHQFSPTLVGTFTAYYKDITGLVGTRYFLPYFNGRFVGYTLYVNEDYANVKGFEVMLNLRRTGLFAGSLSYTYSVAKGSASSETEDYPGTTESTILYPLDFDKTHLLNVNVNAAIPAESGPRIFGMTPLANTVWSIVFRVNSGRPYTPGGRDVGFVERNSARMPATYSLDAEISKEWKLGKMTLGIFAEMLNLTGHRNVLSIYTDTGEPDVTLIGNNSDEYIKDPSNFGPPRRIRLGAEIRF